MLPFTDTLDNMLQVLGLRAFMNNFQKMAEAAERDKISHFEYLKQLTQLELSHRYERRIAHLLKHAHSTLKCNFLRLPDPKENFSRCSIS